MPDLELDNEGNVRLYPLSGWTIARPGGVAIGLFAEYVNSLGELETGVRHQLQLVMTPQQCLELAEALARNARELLRPDDGSIH